MISCFESDRGGAPARANGAWFRGAWLSLSIGTLLLGCSTRSVTGGESNWLVTCDKDAMCGEEMACRCGVCTLPCDSSADCANLSGALCVSATSSAAGTQCVSTPLPLCLPQCDSSRPCPAGQDCTDGACTLKNVAAQCASEGNGATIDHVPDPSDVYLPDCDLTLAREYYRVFRKADGTAYMVPRPDGNPDLYQPCVDPQNPLATIVERYNLCENAASSADVDRVNAMTPEHALAIAHYLHEQLTFFGTDSAVTPHPNSSDILEACKTDPAFRDGLLTERCTFELDAEQSDIRPDIGFTLTADQAAALAKKMNELYAITGDDLCQRLAASAAHQVNRRFSASLECTTDSDCGTTANSSDCHDQCEALVSDSGRSAVAASIEAVNGAQCSAWAAAECGPVNVPPCIAFPSDPVCVNNECAYPDLATTDGSGGAPTSASGATAACARQEPDPANPDEMQCSYAAAYISCQDPTGAGVSCLSDDKLECKTANSGSVGSNATCTNVCTADEYALSCGRIGSGPSASAPAACRTVANTPGGISFYCCPCGT